jgi:DegV family protein with EDD domain
MKNRKIVADSSANVHTRTAVPFASAALKIITSDREYVDDATLDVAAMVSDFDSYKGKSKTSCPNPQDWLDAFGDAQEVFCVTITSGLSGSYNSACVAKQMYEAEKEDAKVFVIDSLSAGPELLLIIEKLEELIAQELPFEEICTQIKAYQKTTGLEFMLQSLKNLAANGRVNPAVAKIVTLLGIRIVGKASDQGTLENTDKCRGQARSLAAMVKNMEDAGLKTGKVIIAHCENEQAARELEQLLAQKLPQVQVQSMACTGLCSFYAEKGGMMVGFEKF